MICPHCSKESNEDANFCFSCGTELKEIHSFRKKKSKISPNVPYNGYLSVGGWLIVLSAVLASIYLYNKSGASYWGHNDDIVLPIFLVFASIVIYAWLYFGLHKIILKVSRIEQALEINNEVEIKIEQESKGVISNQPKTKTSENTGII